ncbi:MAG: hypothetical protein OJF50_006461 [Nitrospira sp.]|nr:hypothetical protein [Nitrospira sp.]
MSRARRLVYVVSGRSGTASISEGSAAVGRQLTTRGVRRSCMGTCAWLCVVTSMLVLAVFAPASPVRADFDKLFTSQDPGGEDWKGYYYYQDPLPDVEVPDRPQQLAPSPAIPLQPEHFKDQLALKEALKQLPVARIDLPNLPAAWLKILLTAKKEAALDAQKEDTLLSYLKVHKEAFNRSQRFTDMWALVMYTHPELDFASTNPVSSVGHEIYAEQKKMDEDTFLSSLKEKVGLFFFYTSTCPYCQKQSQILRTFSDTYGLSVKAVTRDGYALPEWPDSVADNGMGDQIGVTKVPTIFVAIPEEQFLVPVGAGILTMQELYDRLVMILQKRVQLKKQFPRS